MIKEKRICKNCFYYSNSIWSNKLLYCTDKKKNIPKNNWVKRCFVHDDGFESHHHPAPAFTHYH